MDYLAETESSVPDVSAPGWFPRWVLTSYGIALGAAGAVAADQSELPAQLRALGVSSAVLGVGCVLLASRQKTQARSGKAVHRRRESLEPVEVPAPAPEVSESEDVVLESDETIEVVTTAEQVPTELESQAADVELPSEVPIQVPDTIESIDLTAEAARIERLEAELADERERVDRVTADLAALRRVVIEQREKSSL